ncbi:MAG: hypothetical protein JXA99_03485 [Candidatus Lokiarchaeota archaeon]|nr:hypothetical protein [Candidatus Lokiarchaeota archaeon]
MNIELEWDLKNNQLYKSPRLTLKGLNEFPILLKKAIENGNDISFSDNLKNFFKENEKLIRDGIGYEKKIPYDAHFVLGQGQFNIYYMRAICQMAISQGIKTVEVYRAKKSQNPRKSSQNLIKNKINAKDLLGDLRNSDFGSKKFSLGFPNSGLSVKY